MITSKKIPPWMIGFLLGVFILAISGSLFFFFLFQDRIYPGVKIDNIEVGGLTRNQAFRLLEHELELPEEHSISIRVDDIKLSSSSAELEISRKYDEAITQAFEVGRIGSYFSKTWIITKASFAPIQFKTKLVYHPEKLEFFVNELKKKVDLVGHSPKANLRYSGSPYSLTIDPGEAGRELVLFDTIKLLESQIEKPQPLSAPVASTSTVLSQEQIASASAKANKLIGQRLILRAEDVRLDLNDQQLVSLIAFPEGFNEEEFNSILSEWQEIVTRPTQDAEFIFDQDTLQVEKFIPHRDGLELNLKETTNIIKETINSLTEEKIEGKPVGINNQTNIELGLPVETTQPQTTLAATNELGIKEKIGFGESEYDYSIPNRIHNVDITTKKVSDVIIPPGKEFSFNQTLGEVSNKTGFRSAYVIKDGRTELGDGGGVCQVSTTTFRAALDAGLEITRRLPHSYRVSYYELNSKPGIDATVYSGNVDLRFINDTDHHILIHGEADSDDLYMKVEIWGTSDGRSTEITDHQVWGYTSPPPPEYYPDSTLAPGVKKQIDWSVGGVKAKFTHIIRDSNGETVSEKTYHSNYRPWSAKYLVGE